MTGSSLDFKVRKESSTASKFLAIDLEFAESESRVPMFAKLSPNAAQLIHFDSLLPLKIPPNQIFTLRVTLLEDATLLGFRMPHFLTDAQAGFDVIKAYCDLLAGNTIPTLAPPPDYKLPLSQLVRQDLQTSSSTSHTLEGVRIFRPDESFTIGIWHILRLALILIWRSLTEGLFASNTYETGYALLPKNLVARWQADCQEELENSKIHGISLSKQDIVTAWLLKVIPYMFQLNSHLTKKGAFAGIRKVNHHFDLVYPFDSRFSINAPKEGTIYLKDSHYYVQIRWPSISKLQNSSLAQVALAIRLGVLQTRNSDTMKQYHEFYEKHINDAISFGPPGFEPGYHLIVSSWTGFSFHGLDFSNALLEPKSETSDARIGKAVFMQPSVFGPLKVENKPTMIVLKDQHGNYWITGSFTKAAWKALGRQSHLSMS